MKILIFTKNWLGDVLFEVPAIKALRDNFPEARLTALAPARCLEILKALPYLDGVRIFDERGSERPVWAKIRLIRRLRQEKFDKVFLFHRSFTRALVAWLGGIPERVGYETPKRRRLLTKAVPQPRQAMHQADYFLNLLKWAGLRVPFGAEYEFFCRKEDEEEAGRLLESCGLKDKRFAAFHIGANWEPKRWPAAHFARLAGLLIERLGCKIVLTGSERDESIAESIQGQVPEGTGTCPWVKGEGVLSLCGRTSLGVLGAVYKRAEFVVSSDSGPLHIASGVGTPVVALFGPTSPVLTGPRGTGKKTILQFVPEGYSIPWKGKVLPERGWMERISPEEVFEKICQTSLSLR